MDNFIKVLMGCPIFKALSETEILTTLKSIKYNKRCFEKNEVLFRTGDIAHHIAIIISGSIEIRKYLPTGNILSVFQRAQGEVLGGSIMFSSIPQYPCDVVAKENCELIFIEKQYVVKTLLKNETIASNILKLSANRIMQFEKRLELFSFYSIQKKIVFSLLHDFEQDKTNSVVLPFSKTSWSEYLNVSRTSLSRELKSLCNQNLIKMEGLKITIINIDLLEALLW